MKLNQVNFENFPETGELVWFAQDSSGGGLISEKGWIPAIWLGPVDDDYLDRHGHTFHVKAMMEGKVRNDCHIGRFHRGDSPPDEGDGWT